MKKTFLFGAGFNLDANSLVTPKVTTNWLGQEYNIREPYLDMIQFAPHIFPAEQVSNFEERLAQALNEGDTDRLQEFVCKLMAADYYTANRLEETHIYSRFLEYCGPTTFLTFNYDSLMEIQLFKQGHWYPHDGFGVQAIAKPQSSSILPSGAKSINKVLHLHGTYLLYSDSVNFTDSSSGTILEFGKPRFIFDPERLSPVFSRETSEGDYLCYPSQPADLAWKHPQNRILAPIPDKAQSLTKPYIQECYSQAAQIISQSEALVAIGYSFPDSDSASYTPLLNSLFSQRKGKVFVINPEAEKIVKQLQKKLPGNYEPIRLSFKEWTVMDFPLH